MEDKSQDLVTTNTPLTAIDIRKQVNLVQEVMKNVMKKDEHYGVIPGCTKPTLYKPGAEKLALTFRLSAEYEELSGSIETENLIIYKINCKLTHIPSGNIISNGRGTCNSMEKKFKTRSVYANKATDEEKAIGKKEEKIGQGGNKYFVYIIPNSPFDLQNTLYKMACKRAYIAAILSATAASDIFTQDIEDLPEGIVIDPHENIVSKPTTQKPNPLKQEKPNPAPQKPMYELPPEVNPNDPDFILPETESELETAKPKYTLLNDLVLKLQKYEKSWDIERVKYLANISYKKDNLEELTKQEVDNIVIQLTQKLNEYIKKEKKQ